MSLPIAGRGNILKINTVGESVFSEEGIDV